MKSSRIEGGGDCNSYAVDHKPKDMLHDKRHYFVWVFYDRKGEEFFQCCRMSEFVIFSSGKKGNFVSNHTWWTDRGRLHLTIDENTGFPRENNIPKAYRHTLDYLLEEHDTSTVDEIITQQEKEQKWKTTKKITEFEINKNFLTYVQLIRHFH